MATIHENEERPTCFLHGQGYDSDCEHCVAEVAWIDEQLGHRAKEAEDTFQFLARHGRQIDPGIVWAMQFEVLMQALLNPKQMQVVRLRMANEMRRLLTTARQETTRATLTQPGPVDLSRFKGM